MKQMFPSLTQLAAEVERQNAAKVDYLVDSDRIHFVSKVLRDDDGNVTHLTSEVDLLVPNGPQPTLSVNDVAHKHIAAKLDIPRSYYDRLRPMLPSLLDENVNRLLRHNPKPWMVRALDDTARACLSPSYRRLDNYEVLGAVLPALSELPGCKIRSSAVTDTRMYLKVVTPLQHELKVGATVAAGVTIQNSEVGYGSLKIYPFIETLECTNGMTFERKGDGMMNKIHLGRRVDSDDYGRIMSDEAQEADDRAFLLTCRDVVRAACSEARFSSLVAEMAKTIDSSTVQDITAGVQVLAKREGLLESEAKRVLQHLAEGGDLSQWGVLSAVTRTAEDLGDYDRASELETIGGKIVGYSQRDWREIAEAVA